MKRLYLKEERQNAHIYNGPRYPLQMFLALSYHFFHNWVALLKYEYKKMLILTQCELNQRIMLHYLKKMTFVYHSYMFRLTYKILIYW